MTKDDDRSTYQFIETKDLTCRSSALIRDLAISDPTSGDVATDLLAPPPGALLIMSRKIRVLVVDDDSLLRTLVAEQLTKAEFDSAPVASGRQALDILRDADYDVILLDIMMPDLSGLDALRAIRKLEDPPEVIML